MPAAWRGCSPTTWRRRPTSCDAALRDFKRGVRARVRRPRPPLRPRSRGPRARARELDRRAHRLLRPARPPHGPPPERPHRVSPALGSRDAPRQPRSSLRAQRLHGAREHPAGSGGGMDQAIILGAQAGYASRIDFHPLRLTPTAVPADWQFIVAWSLVHAEKSGAARQAYNERTQQCDEARRLVAARLGQPADITYPALLAAASVEELLQVAGGAPPPPLPPPVPPPGAPGGRPAPGAGAP